VVRLKRWFAFLLAAAFFTAGLVTGGAIFDFHLRPWVLTFLALVAAGGFGGVVQALIGHKDQLRWPGWALLAPDDPDPRPRWDAGFLSDLAIGILGAVAGLIFAMGLLGDQFFGAVHNTPSQVVAPPWVRIVAFGALAGFAARQLLPALSNRLANVVIDQVKQEMAPALLQLSAQIEETRVQSEVNQLRLDSRIPTPPAAVLASQAHTAATASQAGLASAATPGAPPPPPPWIATLDDLAARFSALPPSADLASRTTLAEAMLAALTTANPPVTADELVQAVGRRPDDAHLVALASFLAAHAGEGHPDQLASQLLDAVESRANDNPTTSPPAALAFLLDRVLLALLALDAQRPHAPSTAQRARRIAERALRSPDPALRRRASAALRRWS
jgi:hypothetical protein